MVFVGVLMPFLKKKYWVSVCVQYLMENVLLDCFKVYEVRYWCWMVLVFDGICLFNSV